MKRSGTLQAQIERPGTSTETPSPPQNEEEYYDEGFGPDEDIIYLPQPPSMNQSPSYLQTTFGRDNSLWKTQENDWRTIASSNGLNSPNHGIAIDDVQRALSSLELSSSDSQSHFVSNANYDQNRGNAHPPRFNHGQSQPQAPAMRRERHANSNSHNDTLQQTNRSNMLQLGDIDNGKNYNISNLSGTLTPIGHNIAMMQSASSQRNIRDREGLYATSNAWDQKERMLNTGNSNSNVQYDTTYGADLGLTSTSPAPTHFLPQGASAPRLGVNTNFAQSTQSNNQNIIGLGNTQQSLGFLSSPIDVPSLIASKGYNPTQFDIQPPFVSAIANC